MGNLWQPVVEQQPMGRKVRTKTLRRWGLPLVVGGLLIASLTSAVRRSEDGRRLSQELDRLEVDELIMRDRVATQTARADSLAALPRMEDAAREIGLRRAEDGEVFHLSDPSAGRADEGEAPGVGTR